MPTVILKPTKECNSNCAYCEAVRHSGPVRRMPYEMLERFYCLANDFLLSRPDQHINITWHGGEPLLVGPDYFNQALKYQEQHCHDTQDRISYDIQTNLTLFTPAFADIFHKMKITSVGTSFDPVPKMRGPGIEHDSDRYNREFMRGVRYLQSEGINWGAICVVTKQMLKNPVDAFLFLSNMSPFQGVNFNPVAFKSGDPRFNVHGITSSEYHEFLIKVFEFWWPRRNRYRGVEPFGSTLHNLTSPSIGVDCSLSGECADSHIGIEPDGTITQCGCSGDYGILSYGNISNTNFQNAFAHPDKAVLRRRNAVLIDTDCHGCRFWNMCHGGCPVEAWLSSDHLMRKSPWCSSVKGLANRMAKEIAAEQAKGISQAESKVDRQPAPVEVCSPTLSHNRDRRNEQPQVRKKTIWINPIGGFGDALMISGVLRQIYDMDKKSRFALVSRTKYAHIFGGHPAIGKVGHPPVGAAVLDTAYWEQEKFINGGARAYQVLAEMFGLETPAPEILYVPWGFEDNPSLLDLVPWKKFNILIAPTSDSPRKEMAVENWAELIRRFDKNRFNFVQIGRLGDQYVGGAVNLIGLTTVREAISIIRHFDLVVTSDNLVMHACHLHHSPAVVLWGPTDPETYGYADQIHLKTARPCGHSSGLDCLASANGEAYSTVCPNGSRSCINSIPIEEIHHAVNQLIDHHPEKGGCGNQ